MGEMKTQVIQLEPLDDVTSVRDKMAWAKTPRILLVFPHHSRILSRTLDLRLLRRHAATLGAQLAIVTRSGDLRRIAQAVGIPAFNTVASAQRKTWEGQPLAEKPRRRTPRPDLRQMRHAAFPAEAHWRTRFVVRFLFFSLAVLAVLTLLLPFLPSASIKLTPETHQQSLTVAVSASPAVATVNLTGTIPARLIFTTLERSKTAPVSGSITIPDSLAAGIVRFRNLTAEAVGIPAGTIVRTTGDPPVRFATTTDASLAAGVGEMVDVTVQAVEAGGGASGNLPADSLVAIEGDLGVSLAVTNPGSTAGGSDRTAPAQTADDRIHLHDALLSEILQECKAALPKMLASGDVYFPDTLAVGQLLSETYFPAEGQTGETLSLTMNLQCQVQYASAADVNTLAEMALDANLPDGFIPVSGEVTTPVASIPKTDTDGITRWEMQPQRLLRAHLDPLAATQLALGRRPAQAARRLSESFQLASVPKIQVKPSWWPWLPIVPFRITISTGD
jgi:hypothetical protein